ncbi:MAG: hypothetical protein WBX02_21340 [Terriglobales bacterium]
MFLYFTPGAGLGPREWGGSTARRKKQVIPFGSAQGQDDKFYVPQMVGTDPLTIFVADMVPTLGALGFAGAHAMIGPGDGGSWQFHKSGCVVRVYCAGGGAADQKTGSGLTVVGAAENVPTAMS